LYGEHNQKDKNLPSCFGVKRWEHWHNFWRGIYSRQKHFLSSYQLWSDRVQGYNRMYGFLLRGKKE